MHRRVNEDPGEHSKLPKFWVKPRQNFRKSLRARVNISRPHRVLWGIGISQNVVWYVVRACCKNAGLKALRYITNRPEKTTREVT